jgi:uncharacterized repeat protein (TIGR03806 family)
MVKSRSRRHGLSTRWATPAALLVAAGACSGSDETRVYDPRLGDPGSRPLAYLGFPPEARHAPRSDGNDEPNFPRLLSATGAFRDVAQLEPATGLVPYDLQAPLWSDGADKHRWISVPALGSVVVSDQMPWRVAEGTVLVKHFEMALDERQPEVHRRLETRLLVAAQGGSFYGVTYKWNNEGTDAEIVLEAETEQLSMVDAEGAEREQPYFYPGPSDCLSCHTSSAGYVLGLRTRQLNRELDYGNGHPAINQLLAWSGWGFLDRAIGDAEATAAPRLANVADESEGLERRVRSYWDSNCSMCHAGQTGSVKGWDARFFTPPSEQGLSQPPQMIGPDVPAALIDPGDPEHSYIYQRSATVDKVQRMPPIGRNRVDAKYIDVLARWIDSL